MAGLFFCFASADGAGLLFCPAEIQPHTSVYSEFCAVHATIPPTQQNSARGFTEAFPAICRIFFCCVAVYPAILHHLRHDGAYHSAVAPPANTRYQRHAGRYTGQHSRPIIIRYIRAHPCCGFMPDSAADCRLCKPGGVLMFPTPSISLAPG